MLTLRPDSVISNSDADGIEKTKQVTYSTFTPFSCDTKNELNVSSLPGPPQSPSMTQPAKRQEDVTIDSEEELSQELREAIAMSLVPDQPLGKPEKEVNSNGVPRGDYLFKSSVDIKKTYTTYPDGIEKTKQVTYSTFTPFSCDTKNELNVSSLPDYM
jgi:deoxyribodipyrimidine photolyase